MKIYKIILACLLLLALSVSMVSAEDVNQTDDTLSDSADEGTFSDLNDTISSATDHIEIEKNYKYDLKNDTKFSDGISKVIPEGSKLTIEGNNKVIDANGNATVFRFAGGQVTINNLVIKNSAKAAIILFGCNLTTNNVTFENNTDNNVGSAVYGYGALYYSNNDKFINNYAPMGSSIFVIESSLLSVTNATFRCDAQIEWGLIYADNSMVNINSTTVENINSKYATVLYGNGIVSIKKSRFVNLASKFSAGAIGIKGSRYTVIEDCEFINVTSTKNGGAIFVDVPGDTPGKDGLCTIERTSFVNCSSEFGGAVLQLGGNLHIYNSNFTSNKAAFEGGAIYVSNSTMNVVNSTFDSNSISDFGKGGALFFDNGDLEISNSLFKANYALYGAAIYAYDSEYDIELSNFTDNINNTVYTYFDRKGSAFANDNKIDDKPSLNNVEYETYVEFEGKKIVLNPQTIEGKSTDAYFSLRDQGLVTPVKNQGSMGACWAFGATGALESAFLIATNQSLDISENNIQSFILRYSKYGKPSLVEGGYIFSGMGYFLSWLGAVPTYDDEYDELGKISSVKFTPDSYHILDAVIIDPENATAVKEALTKYGALTVFVSGADPDNGYYNKVTYAEYCNNASAGNHFVTLVGWNDTYSQDNFNITPPGDGAWICKNSWGTNWGDEGYFYLSYYDLPFKSNYAVGYAITNTETYEMLYQLDISGLDGYRTYKGGKISYGNTYVAANDEWLAAVGTYFKNPGEDYEITIFVNGHEVYTQKGKSAIGGYNTIKLNSLVSLKAGEKFLVEFEANAMPMMDWTRQHFEEGTSLMAEGGEVTDLSALGIAACVKAYTVHQNFTTTDVIQYYSPQVTILSNLTGAQIIIQQEGKTIASGIVADGKVTFKGLASGNYSIRTVYNGTSVINALEIKNTIIAADAVKISLNTELTVESIFLNGNGTPLANTGVTVILDGKKYSMTTDKKGVLDSVLQKLELGTHKFVIKNPATSEEWTVTVTVVERFTYANNVNMYYYDGSAFRVQVTDNSGNVVGANEVVTIKINKKTYRVKTNAKGYAVFKIPKTVKPGTYKITAIYAGVQVDQKVKVKQVLKLAKVKVKKSAKKLIIKATLKQGKKALKGKKIVFKFKGKKYIAKTNKKGIAKITVKKSVLKKLKAGKKITYTATYLKDTVKRTVKVKK